MNERKFNKVDLYVIRVLLMESVFTPMHCNIGEANEQLLLAMLDASFGPIRRKPVEVRQ